MVVVAILVVVIFIIKDKLFQRKKVTGEDALKKYTIVITSSFSERDSNYMRPIFTLVFAQSGIQEEAVLCYVLNHNGELNLNEAEGVMIKNIKSALKTNVFVKAVIHNEGLLTDKEKSVIAVFNRATKKWVARS